MPRYFGLSLIERFESHIISKDNCWLTDLSTTKDGYPQISINGKQKRANRIAYQLYKEEIPEGLICRHRCDNPACVNPDHLELGTYQDNTNDCVQRNRQAKGEKHGSA